MPLTLALTAALSLTTILSGCGSTDTARLDAAAAATGKAAAGVSLPEWPDRCRAHMERVMPKAGEKARWVQKRWEIVADQQDRRTDDCAAYYDDVRAGLAGESKE
ncbi:hypothetical protein [uncultured Pleomorphomonas sp.]|nr:hypothetical protein [uncultured Pleomorphomonas sp.]